MDPQLLCSALARRREALPRWHAEDTDGYRLLHGAVEGAPGVTIDRYGPVLLVQTWREPLADDALAALTAVAEEAVGVSLVPVCNHRAARLPALEISAEVRELGAVFDARPRHAGQDPLLFLDLRCVRRRLRSEVAGRSVLNLFAYTCGVGVVAGLGGATEVWNVDFARAALDVGRANVERNHLTGGQRFVREDCLAIMRQLAGRPVGRRGQRAATTVSPRTFDVVVLDPPRWSTGRYGAVDLVNDYAGVFKLALACVAPGGVLVATNNVASVDRAAWLEGLHRCADKAGRPLGAVDVVVPEEDFPSPDGQHPLKVAWCAAP